MAEKSIYTVYQIGVAKEVAKSSAITLEGTHTWCLDVQTQS